MHNIISKVEKLIRLAGSNNENEARNAAYVAAILINSHNLMIVTTEAHASVSTNAPKQRAVKQPNVEKSSVSNIIDQQAKRIVEILQSNAKQGWYPTINIKHHVEKLVKDKIISSEDALNVTARLRIALKQNESIEGVRGPGGGFRLKTELSNVA